MKRFSVAAAAASFVAAPVWAADSGFNPAISATVDAGLSYYSNEEAYEIAGYPLAGEAGVAEEGFAINEVEMTASAPIDDKFYGQATLGLHYHEGETELHVEEAYLQTTALPHGLTVKAGQFFSEFGYMNAHHKHAWDFADAPLAYRAMLGRQLNDTGLQFRWVAPTDLFTELGAEWTRGDAFPAGGSGSSGRGAVTLFGHLGGDWGSSHSWQFGVSYFTANHVAAELSGHSHAHGEEEVDNEFEGKTKVVGVDWIYKWAPNGNARERNLTVQAEWMARSMEGDVFHSTETEDESSSLDADQSGWYLQTVYQFKPQWRVGLRYDQLTSDNRGSDEEVLEEVGFADEGVEPSRATVMLDYSPSEFSRIRLQFSDEDSRHPGEDKDQQWQLQYVYSLGAHGAHRF